MLTGLLLITDLQSRLGSDFCCGTSDEGCGQDVIGSWAPRRYTAPQQQEAPESFWSWRPAKRDFRSAHSEAGSFPACRKARK